MINKKIFMFGIILSLLLSFVYAQETTTVGTQTSTVCCEQTISGAFCQNVPATECKVGSRAIPTSCSATSYCRSGTCYDSSEGVCLDNTPQLVCNANSGAWSAESPPQCGLGCCILGDQAAFVSLVRCKKLSATLGLQTNYDKSIGNEISCIQKVQQQEEGACVYTSEFESTCKFTTRAICNTQTGGNASIQKGTFYSGKLCSSEELGTNCGPTTKTTCIPGKDEVYFVDTCGNPANIYDASKIKDKEYWTDVKRKDEVCNPAGSNALSASCGNCNYLQGSICRGDKIAGATPTYGDNICADLNCKVTSNGKSYKHGESWCVYKDKGGFDNNANTVGSRFYRHICQNSEEVLEQCDDFRAEECVEDNINGFSQSACRVNRWQDCLGQTNPQDCANIDKRDCLWKEGVFLQTLATNRSNSDEEVTGTCFPKNKPGFNFWDDKETKVICAQANAQCVVKFEKGLFGAEKCTENCDCLEPKWEAEQAAVCTALGDCGPALNWLGQTGYNKGYKVTIGQVKKEEKK